MENVSNNLFSVLGGMATGFVLGVLFAPEKGSKTRKRILDTLDELTDEIVHESESLWEKARQKHNLDPTELEQRLDALLDHTGHQEENIIEILERKLQALKDANKDLKPN